MSDTVIGWDLGGAHLKAARLGGDGSVEAVVQLPCPLWQGLSHLHQAMSAASARLGDAAFHAVTMTGEMVDLFPSRAEGVAALVSAVTEHVPSGGLRFFAGSAGFLSPDAALPAAARIASANWLATAGVVADRIRTGLLLDIGSTTADVVAVRDGRVRAWGENDAARLVSGELVYTGVVRTPVMALADRVVFEGESVPLMAEYFATSADVYRLTGELPPDADMHPAADGGEKTVAGSTRRLARMVGRDAESATPSSWRDLADRLRAAQLRRIGHGCDQVLHRERLPADAPIVAAGVGRFLAPEIAARLGRRVLAFARLLPPGQADPEKVTDCAPAVAVAWLARKQLAPA